MPIDREKLTPMMRHYLSIKDQYPDALILYRLGDFYELFFDDAKEASRILELALTARDCGLEERAPMCGVPHHVVETYVSKLVSAGKKVALVEQMEDPREAKGLVKRSVTRVITPGTLTDGDVLQQNENNYLLALFPYGNSLGFCYADLSTGEVYAGESLEVGDFLRVVNDRITSLEPAELLIIGEELPLSFWRVFEQRSIFLTFVSLMTEEVAEARKFLEQYLSRRALRVLEHHPLTQLATATLFQYIYQFQDEPLVHINRIQWIVSDQFLGLNASTRENLELLENLQTRTKRHSLLWALDATKTAMGSRLLRHWIEMPLVEQGPLEHRLDMVEALEADPLFRLNVRDALDAIYDLERLLGKLSYNRGNARDLLALATALTPIPAIKEQLARQSVEGFANMNARLDSLEDLREPIQRAIREDAPIGLREGGLIRTGYDADLDAIREGSDAARQALIAYEAAERERTGIKNLRVVFKKNAGYFIEVTNSYLDRVPDSYRRRQTLKNAERFVTEELEKQEARIVGDEQAIFDKEYQLFQALRKQVTEEALRIQTTAHELARLDVLASFAQIASDHQYTRPHFRTDGCIVIEEGRHPVVERTTGSFIPNDTRLGGEAGLIHIITGPNMAGKSTYMRQVALLQVMAQIGSFVPAKRCELSLVDQIFTRIGATDNLARGDSTFMVEMKEMAEILSSMTSNSLLILDEVGRGTSTNDGLSIACAILEHLAKRRPAKTLFATHYHELTAIADRFSLIRNLKVDIEESKGALLFLRKVIPGKADRSYGIEVARLSGLPEEVLQRAEYFLQSIDREEGTLLQDATSETEGQQDFSDFQKDLLLHRLCEVDIESYRPLEAMNLLQRFVEEARKIGSSDGKDEK